MVLGMVVADSSCMDGSMHYHTYVYAYRYDRIMKTSVAKKVLDHALRRGIVEVCHCALCVLSPYNSEERPSAPHSRPIVMISMPTHLHTHTPHNLGRPLLQRVGARAGHRHRGARVQSPHRVLPLPPGPLPPDAPAQPQVRRRRAGAPSFSLVCIVAESTHAEAQ